ncbi:hypothetical protein BGX29_011059 [Mortierella sp. GBA35]|nr:hypothetical protein BGX29_011059 [Mortierella sp. GBA35]
MASSGSPLSTTNTDGNYQTFRSHGTLVRLKVSTGHLISSVPTSKYIFWSDLRVAFPGILRLQHDDIILTFMRADNERRIKPFRVECIPGAILDVIYKSSTSVARSVSTIQSIPSSAGNSSSSKGADQQGRNRTQDTSDRTTQVTPATTHPRSTAQQHASSASVVPPNPITTTTTITTTKANTPTSNADDTNNTTATSTSDNIPRETTLMVNPEHHSHSARTLGSSDVSSPSLGTSGESEDYDVVDEHSTDLESIEEVVEEQDQEQKDPHKPSSSSHTDKEQDPSQSPPNPTAEQALSVHKVSTFKDEEKVTAATFLHILAPPQQELSDGPGDKAIDKSNDKGLVGGKPKRQSLLQLILSAQPPQNADKASRAEFEEIRVELLTCVHFFYGYLKSTTDYQILQAERRGRILFATLLGLKLRIPMDHPLRVQYETVIKDTNSTRMLFRQMRPEFLQPKVDQLTSIHYGVFEHLEQKMFVILPKGDTAAEGFRLYFLCECSQYTKPTKEEAALAQALNPNSKKKSAPPHHFHFTRHEGYELLYVEEFIARYGYHMWVILQMLVFGYTDDGVDVPPLDKTSELYKKVMCTLTYIHHLPDSGKVDGSWDFARVKDFYVPYVKNKEGSPGSLFRIITKEGYAKWVCFDHYKERFPENDYKVLQATLKRFFYNEALGAVLVSLCSRKDATAFYEAIVKAVNLQELGLELAWDVTEDDIAVLQSVILRTTAVSIKLFVPFEHHIVNGPINLKEPCRGVDVHDPNYILGHFKTNLVKHLVDCRRIQAFFMDISDPSDHPDNQESLDRTFRNMTSFKDWEPDRMNPALCDMVRTAGPNARTKLSFNSPTLERGFHFMNNAIKGDVGLVMLKAMVSYNEQVSIRSGKDEARKSMRIQRWSNSTLRFANKLERLWLEVHTPQEIKVLQQLIELNPCLQKLRVMTEALQFFKVYQAIKTTLDEAGPSRVSKKIGLRDKFDMSLTWAEKAGEKSGLPLLPSVASITPDANRPPTHPMSLSYSRKSSNIYTVLMFFGYMLTHLKCLEFSNHDAKTLEASMRTRGSQLASVQINILGLDKKGFEYLSKVLERSKVPMSQLSSHFAVYLSPVEGIKSEWKEVTKFMVRHGACVDELVLIGSMDDGLPLATFFDTVTPKVLPFLEILIVVGALSKSISLGKGGIGTSFPKAVATSGFVLGSPHSQNSVKSSQMSRRFLPWLQSFVSELRLHKLGLNRLSLESTEWVGLLKRIQFADLKELDLFASRMPTEVFRNLGFFIPPLPIPTVKTSGTAKSTTATTTPSNTPTTTATTGANNGMTESDGTRVETIIDTSHVVQIEEEMTTLFDGSKGVAAAMSSLPGQCSWETLGGESLTTRSDYAAYQDAIELKIGDRTEIHFRRIEAQYQAKASKNVANIAANGSDAATITATTGQERLVDQPLRKIRIPWNTAGDEAERALVRHAMRTHLRGYELE